MPLPIMTFFFFKKSKAHCAVPEKIHTHPMEGHRKFLGGGGVLKVKILEAKYEAKLEFPGGMGGAKQKTFRGGSMDIFWNCTFQK